MTDKWGFPGKNQGLRRANFAKGPVAGRGIGPVGWHERSKACLNTQISALERGLMYPGQAAARSRILFSRGDLI